MTSQNQNSSYRWLMITLATCTSMFVIAMPTMSLPVLFDEISAELELTLVQIGWVWGISSLTGMFLGFFGGIFGDRFGTRRVLILACLGVGVLGAARGLATSFSTLIAASFLMGIAAPMIGVNLHMVAGQWFSRSQLGLANGLISAGFAAGFLMGSLLSATVLSPLLGGWRQVLFFYGVIALCIALLWFIIHPRVTAAARDGTQALPLRAGVARVVRLRNIWLIGLGKIGVWGCVRGFTGYLPLYLRGVGWDPALADAALAAFFTFSLLGAVSIPMVSDKLGVRKPFLLAAALMIGTAVWLLGLVDGWLVFAAVMLGGVIFDAFMAITITTTTETKGVGLLMAGTAIGFVFFLQEIGGLLAPPLGNSLASISPQLPFYFWGSLALLALIPFTLLRTDIDPVWREGATVIPHFETEVAD